VEGKLRSRTGWKGETFGAWLYCNNPRVSAAKKWGAGGESLRRKREDCDAGFAGAEIRTVVFTQREKKRWARDSSQYLCSEWKKGKAARRLVNARKTRGGNPARRLLRVNAKGTGEQNIPNVTLGGGETVKKYVKRGFKASSGLQRNRVHTSRRCGTGTPIANFASNRWGCWLPRTVIGA